MKSRTRLAIISFVIFAVREVGATDPSEEIGALPVCAQACITSGFARCGCKLTDFICACKCSTFVSFCNSCTDTSCSSPYLQSVLDMISNSCPTSSSRSPSRLTAPLLSQSSTDTIAPTTTLILESTNTPTTSTGGLYPSETSHGPDAGDSNPSAVDYTSTGGQIYQPTTPPYPPYPSPSVPSYCSSQSFNTTYWNQTHGNFTHPNCPGEYNGPQYIGRAMRLWTALTGIILAVAFGIGITFV